MLEQILFDLPPEANYQLPDPALVQHYKNRNLRVYWLLDEIDEKLYNLAQFIIDINREDEKIDPMLRKPIKIVIASPGGDLEITETICNLIEISQTPIWGIGIGMVASAASLIYLSCHKKYALPDAVFLYHKGSGNLVGTYGQLDAAFQDYQRKVEKLVKFYISHTSFDEETIRNKMNTDWYIQAQEAIENNACDAIVSDISLFF